MEHENIRVDDAGNTCVDNITTRELFSPLPGYKAMLQLNDGWVTTHYRECIEFANTAPDLQEYAKKRLNFDDETFNDVNWDAIGRVRAHHKMHRIVRTSKMIYRWMPVGHNWQKCKLESDRCPCCGRNDETFEHLLKCDNPNMIETRSNAFALIRLEMVKEEFPSNFIDVFMNALSMIPMESKKKPIRAESLEEAWLAQEEIGFYHMNVGLLSRKWTDALDDFSIMQPESKMELVLTLVWDLLCETMWKQRNDIRHSKENEAKGNNEDKLKDQLRWFTRHRDEVLDYRHRYLAEYSEHDLKRWSHTTLVAKVSTLTNCKQYYDNKIKQRQKQQSTIHDWSDQYMRLRSGRFMGANLRRTNVLPASPPSSDEDSAEAEFDWEPNYDVTTT